MSQTRPTYAEHAGFFDYCPWRFRLWANAAEQAAQLEHQQGLVAAGGVRLGEGCFVSPKAGVFAAQLILGARCCIGGHAYVTDEVQAGDDCTINPFAVVRGKVTMGSGVRIGAHANLIGFNHGHQDIQTPIFRQPETKQGIEIGDDVWIGSAVTVLDGVKIGSHVILAANAVITKDVPDYAVVGGNPGRVLRWRNHQNSAPVAKSSLERRLEQFGAVARAEYKQVLQRCTAELHGQPIHVQHPEHRPTVRAWTDAVEIAHLFGDTPRLLEKPALIATLQNFQDPKTGLIPDPWSPPQTSSNSWHLQDHLERYHLLAVGYALELLGGKLLYPIKAVAQLEAAELVRVLEGLPWHNDGWMCGDWIDCYATGVYANQKHFGESAFPYTLFGWLHQHVNRFSGMWAEPRAEDGWLQAVNGFYRLTRGSFAQFGLPVPHPEQAIDTVLAHSRDPRFFAATLGNACNVLDVVHPLWLCGLQTKHRRQEVQTWAAAQLERVLGAWQHNKGFSFSLQGGTGSQAQPSLQGTEMWLAIAYLLAEILDSSAALGYLPQGVHRLPAAWSQT